MVRLHTQGRRFAIGIAALAAFGCGYCLPARAGQAGSESPVASVLAEPPIVERVRHIRIGAREIRYVARAGRLPILDDQTGAVQAWIYFTAYAVEPKPGEPPRPLTFIWNGGPGSNSALVHLAGFGPRRIVVPDNPPNGGRGNEVVRIVDNEDTWLTDSDLVFVDPVGTGFSRAVSAEGEAAFLTTLGDAESVAEFIRVYRDHFRAWDQPLIEGGESYGVTRAAWVAETLLRRGIPLKGVLLIGWDIPLGEMASAERHALALPTYTAAAFYHKRLEPDLQADYDRAIAQAARWSQGEYLDAVRRRDSLSPDERARIAAKLARYTGLRPDQIDQKTLNVNTLFHSRHLLRDQNLVIGRYDSRFVASTAGAVDGDLPDIAMDGPDASLVERYLRDEIGYRTFLRYADDVEAFSLKPHGQRQGVSRRWSSESTPREDSEHLEAAFKAYPDLQLIDVCGIYDLGANCIGDQYLIDKAGAPISRNSVFKSYKGGHAPYLAAEARAQMRRDFSNFARSVVAKGGKGQ